MEKERLRLEWFSAAEGQRFANVITEFIEDVKKVGPSPMRNSGKQEKKAEVKSKKGFDIERTEQPEPGVSSCSLTAGHT